METAETAGGAPAEEQSGSFAVDERLADRYRVVRFLARGGAGEVYEAEDLQLGLRVALKTVRPDVAEDPKSLERFKREIQLARQVTHPNVCRIFDFGSHRDGVQFLTMELLEGESLYDRIRRVGPLDPTAALPWIRQIVAGLTAAAEAGVVHRDLKSGNVMLVPRPDGSERVVITDFGLARHQDTGESDTITAETLVVGTPAYMAPEQVSSGVVTPAADQYALGVIVFEMLTGRYPFDASNPLAMAMKRLTEPPSSPRLYVPETSPAWEGAILRSLERDPGKRFASVVDFLDALEASAVDGSRGTDGRHLPAKLVIPALLILAALSAWWGLGGRGDTTSEVPSTRRARSASVSPDTRPAVAILGLRSLSSDPATSWIGPALTEMIAMEAGAGDRLRVVPAETVRRATAAAGDDEDFELLAARLGSPTLVEGSFFAAPSAGSNREIRLDLRVHGPDGEVERISELGSEEGILQLVETAGERLRAALGASPLREEETRAARAALPGTPRAARLYTEGLEHLRRYEARRAIELFEEALRQDPGNARIHSALSSAWYSVGSFARGQAEARAAADQADRLAEKDRMLVEARLHEAERAAEDAARIYATLHDYFPDDLEIGLELVDARIATDATDEALNLIGRLRSMASTVDQPRLDLAAAEAYRSVSDYDAQLEWSLRAAKRAGELGADQLVARAREVSAGALRDLGRHDEALAAYEVAGRVFHEAGDRGRAARVQISRSKVLRHQGRFDEARAQLEEALEVAREIGDQGSLRHGLNTLAIIHRQVGDLERALELHELEVEATRALEDRRSLQVALTSLGVVEQRLGRLEDAREHFTEALGLGRETGSLRSVEINLNLLGEVRLRRGDLVGAREHFEEALAVNEKTGSPRGRAYYLSGLGRVAALEGRLAEARRHLEEAHDLRLEISEDTNVAWSRLDLARLSLLEGDPAEARRMARLAAATFERQGLEQDHAWARLVEAEAVRASGESGEAAALVERWSRAASEAQNPEIRARGAIVSATIRGTSDGLDGAVEAARAIGDVLLELEALRARALSRGDADGAEAAERRARGLGWVMLGERRRDSDRTGAGPGVGG